MRRATRPKHRRKWERLPLAIPVFVRGRDDRDQEFLEFTTALNISGGGALLAVGRKVRAASQVTVEVPSAPRAEGAGHSGATRRLLARLVHVRQGPRGYLLGVKFSRPLLRPRERET